MKSDGIIGRLPKSSRLATSAVEGYVEGERVEERREKWDREGKKGGRSTRWMIVVLNGGVGGRREKGER